MENLPHYISRRNNILVAGDKPKKPYRYPNSFEGPIYMPEESGRIMAGYLKYQYYKDTESLTKLSLN